MKKKLSIFITKFVFNQRISSTQHPTKKYHKVIALTLLFTILQPLVPYNNLLANNNGPNAPEAASFEPVDATDMVNLVTGNLSYVLPIINIPSPEGGYPLALSYRAGIAMDQEATWVGLGWNLNPGAINRSINGYPDDWGATRVNELYYDRGETQEQYNFSIGGTLPNGITLGVSAAWGDHKAWGGIVGYGGIATNFGSDGFGINAYGVSLNFSKQNGTSVGVGLIGTRLGLSNLSLSASYNFNNKSLSISGNAKFLGTGISLDSSNSRNPFSFNSGLSAESNRTTTNRSDYFITGVDEGFNIDIGFFWASYRHTKYTYSLYKDTELNISGALYPYAQNLNHGGFHRYTTHKGLTFMDVKQYTTDSRNGNNVSHLITKNPQRFSFPNFDNYCVSGQGISGSITPQIFKKMKLIAKADKYQNFAFGNGQKHYSTDSIKNLTNITTNQINNFPQGSDINFYFKNTNSSFFRLKSTGFKFISNPNSPGTIVQPSLANTETYPGLYTPKNDFLLFRKFGTIKDNTYASSRTPSGDLKINPSGKKRDGNFIETFTNNDILTGNTSGGFIEAEGINRNNSKLFPKNGIGGYRITTLDGKIYHYSLPVYHFESFYKNFDADDEYSKFFESKKTKPYATHWVLTAITGPDYVDTNSNGKVNVGDLGYWIQFEYGKWTDCFGWRSPKTGYDVLKGSKNYFSGVKQVYYLDKIKTRTHTALFLKDIRKDDMSSAFNHYNSVYNGNGPIHPSSNNTAYAKEIVDREYVALQRRPGIPFNDDYDEYYTDTGEKKLVYRGGPTQTRFAKNNWKYMKIPKQTSLHLSKIVLLKNENVNGVSKYNNTAVPKAYSYYNTGIKGRNGVGSISNNFLAPPEVNTYEYTIHKNVLTMSDVNYNTLKNNAISVIDFNYDYTLSRNLPNSLAGHLTLKSINTLGKSGVKYAPPYQFSYLKQSTPYNYENQDVWGYVKNNVDAWSLNKIITPIGTTIEIDYEEDSFYVEAATSSNGGTGGGLRVKNLKVTDGTTSLTTSYNYRHPVLNRISGITSYAPFKSNRIIKYIEEIPAPNVMYEFVEVSQKDNNNSSFAKSLYKFKTLEPVDNLNPLITDTSNIIFSLGDSFNVIQNQFVRANAQIFMKHTIHNHTSSLGRLESIKKFNNKGQLLNFKENKYRSYNINDQNHSNGIVQQTYETFSKFFSKKFKLDPRTGNSELQRTYTYHLNSSSKVEYPNLLINTKEVNNGITNITNYLNHDFLTGIPLEQLTTNSQGFDVKTITVPAYKKYTAMGSKVDNIDYKNMLAQGASSSTYIRNSNSPSLTWKPIDFQIQTWKDWGNNIWRKYRNYTFDSERAPDGTLRGLLPGFNDFRWGAGVTPDDQPDIWKKTSEITKYSNYSRPLETEDINGNKVSNKMGDNFSKVFATCNAPYESINYMSFENQSELQPKLHGGGTFVNFAHTGSKALKLSINEHLSFDDLNIEEGKYKISLWCNKSAYQNVRIHYSDEENDLTLSPLAGEIVFSNQWVQLNFYLDLKPGDFSAFVFSNSGDLIIDDFRIHPIESSMTSYVYNEWDELSYILGANNMATKYIYNDAGNLCTTYTEVADTPSFSGGFKLVSSHSRKYNGESNITDCHFSLDFSGILASIHPDPSILRATGSLHFDDSFGEKLKEWELDFGDGSAPLRKTTNANTNFVHIYERYGTYTLTLKVTNTKGASDYIKKEIKVSSLVNISIKSDSRVLIGGPPGTVIRARVYTPSFVNISVGGNYITFSGPEEKPTSSIVIPSKGYMEVSIDNIPPNNNTDVEASYIKFYLEDHGKISVSDQKQIFEDEFGKHILIFDIN